MDDFKRETMEDYTWFVKCCPIRNQKKHASILKRRARRKYKRDIKKLDDIWCM